MMISVRTIYKVGLAGLLGIGSPIFVEAQSVTELENHSPEKSALSVQKANDLTKWMQRNLTLTLSQFGAVSHINLVYAHKEDSVDAAVKDHRLHTDAFSKLKRSKDAEFKGILTEAQYKQYVEHREYKPVLKRSPFAGNYLTE
jgi:hypothetical protein